MPDLGKYFLFRVRCRPLIKGANEPIERQLCSYGYENHLFFSLYGLIVNGFGENERIECLAKQSDRRRNGRNHIVPATYAVWRNEYDIARFKGHVEGLAGSDPVEVNDIEFAADGRLGANYPHAFQVCLAAKRTASFPNGLRQRNRAVCNRLRARPKDRAQYVNSQFLHAGNENRVVRKQPDILVHVPAIEQAMYIDSCNLAVANQPGAARVCRLGQALSGAQCVYQARGSRQVYYASLIECTQQINRATQ